MPLSVFRLPNLASANVVMALLGAASIPMWFTANLWLQQVLGSGPFKASAALLPMTILITVIMVAVVARLIARYGVKVPIVAGLAILTAGIALFATVPSEPGGYVTAFLPASLIAAVGMSLTFIPAMMAAIGAAPPEQGGLASGIVNTTYQVGSALGLAAIAALSLSFRAPTRSAIPPVSPTASTPRSSAPQASRSSPGPSHWSSCTCRAQRPSPSQTPPSPSSRRRPDPHPRAPPVTCRPAPARFRDPPTTRSHCHENRQPPLHPPLRRDGRRHVRRHGRPRRAGRLSRSAPSTRAGASWVPMRPP